MMSLVSMAIATGLLATIALWWSLSRRRLHTDRYIYPLAIALTIVILLFVTIVDSTRDRAVIVLLSIVTGSTAVIVAHLANSLSSRFASAGFQLPRAHRKEGLPSESRPREAVSARADGTNGSVALLEDRIRISRPSFSAALIHGARPEREIFIRAIAEVQLRPPSFLRNGYIRFLLIGGSSGEVSLIEGLLDENTVFFNRKQHVEFERLSQMIISKMAS